MDSGRIQQAAPPLEVYDRPANPFVASFIGTPPMNLFPPGVIDLGRTVGLRPEHVALACSRPDDASAIEARVDFVEPLGPETIVQCVLAMRSVHVAARLSGTARATPPAPGSTVWILPDMTHAVAF